MIDGPRPYDDETKCGGGLFIILLMLLSMGLVLLFKSPSPFWIDAEGYAAAAEQGKKVLHPPGYIGFLWIARGLVGWGLDGYQSSQLISLVSFLGSIPFVHSTCRRVGRACAARWCAGMYATCWICLNIADAGTTHASDLLFGSVIAWLLCLPGRSVDRWWWYPVLGAVLTAVVAFRPSTLAMFLPLLAVLLFKDFRNKWLWISGLAGGAAAALILWATVDAYGGWMIYREMTAELNAVNARSGLLSGGEWQPALMNIVRAGGWLLMTAPLAPLLWMTGKKFSPPPFLLTVLVGGCLVVNFGYLCVHPGYLAPMVPAFYAIVASSLSHGKTAAWLSGAQIALVLALFFAGRAFSPPSSMPQAVVNALLLQYSADTHRRALPIKTVSEWLIDSGRGDLAPAHRRVEVEDTRKRKADALIPP